MEINHKKEENTHKKEKAILEQRIEHLELQIKENKTREENSKRLQDSMLSAFRQSANTNVPQELQLVGEQHKREIDEFNEKHKTTVKSLELQITQYQEKISIYEGQVKQLKDKMTEKEKNSAEEISKADIAKMEAEQKTKETTDKYKLLEAKLNNEFNEKFTTQSKIIEACKAEQSKEIEKYKNMSESALKEVKFFYEQDKQKLHDTIESLNQQIKNYENNKEMISQEHANEMQSRYISEVKELNTHLEQINREHEDKLSSITQQRDDALKKVEALEQSILSNAKNIAKNEKTNSILKVKLDKVKELHAQNAYLQDEVKKFKKVVSQLKTQILKMESSEKKLKNMLLDKDTQLDEISKKLNKQPHGDTLKADFDKKKNTMLQEIITKDGQIALLTKQLDEAKKEKQSSNSAAQSKYSRNNGDYSKSVCNGIEMIPMQASNKPTVTIQKMNYMQFLDCQTIVDNCSEVKCRKCQACFQPCDFIAHVESDCQVNDGELAMNAMELLKTNEKFDRKKAADHSNEELASIKEELEISRKKLIQAEQKRAESELSFKTEIKFLVGKLVKYKQKNGIPSNNENISPDSSSDVKVESRIKSGICSPGLNCVARTISNFMRSTPHTDRGSSKSNSQLASDKKGEDGLFSPTGAKTISIIPQPMKKCISTNKARLFK